MWWLGCVVQVLPVSVPSPQDAPPAPPREFRAAWIATVDNIDWPSRKGLPVAEQQQELARIMDQALAVGLNAVVFQVRTCADALYASRLEPWSEWLTGTEGQAPRPVWDPLATAIEEANARGLELHAWFNPYRARHPAHRSPIAKTHVAKQSPDAVVKYGGYLWMDPGHAEGERHTLAVFRDVVRRYDVDGIHIDDYFYPYPVRGQQFPDQKTYAAYRKQGGKLALEDWRRDNVNRFVRALHALIKAEKPWVRFGISPFGIARPGVPAGIKAGIDQYAELYADVVLWLQEGWCDYLAPQLYWPIAQQAQSYPVLLQWWSDQNVKGLHLWPGNFSSQVARGKDPWKPQELLDQIEITRRSKGATGNIHFSMKVLRDDTAGLGTALREGPYATPALVPASPWLGGRPPPAPKLEAKMTGRGLELVWPPPEDEVFVWALYEKRKGQWVFARRLPARPRSLLIDRNELAARDVSAVALSAVGRTGLEGERAVVRAAR